MRRIGYIFMIFCMLSVISCRQINPFLDEEIIARVGDKTLYMSEVESIFTSDLTPQDSIKVLEQYVGLWVKKQLKTRQAEQLFQESASDIERMVEDYRSSLLGYRLDQYVVEAKLDTVLTGDEIEGYYNDHRGDFLLDRDIVKGLIVKLPNNHRQKARVKELMPGSGDRYQDFLDISRKNGFTVHEINTWMDSSDFLNLLPTSKMRNYDDLLTRQGVQEMADGNDLYLIMITAHQKEGDINPLERTSETIRKVIINQRRQELIRNYEDSIYNSAMNTKVVEININ